MRVLCYGASGHGKVVADVIAAAEVCELVGFVDNDSLLDGASVGSVPVIGGASILRDVLRRGRLSRHRGDQVLCDTGEHSREAEGNAVLLDQRGPSRRGHDDR